MVKSSDMNNAKILIVDDQNANVQLLERMLHSAGYVSITSTINPYEVYDLHSNNHYDLILLDLQMPGMDGFQVMEGLKKIEMDGYLPVLVITADPNQKLHALQAGAKDFISKPFELTEVLIRVHNMLEVRLLHMDLKTTSIALETLNGNLQQLVQNQVHEISDAQIATIMAISKIAEARDDDTGKHLERTREYCRIIAQQLQTQPEYASMIDDVFVNNIFHASPLHDIGKVAIQDKILLKPGKLTPEEFEIIKTHTLHGAATLQLVHDQFSRNSFINMGIQIARSHHEKWDGSGYPDGLAGEEIPICAQIMALADVYDALLTKRCYKEAFSHKQSCEIIFEGRKKHFAPDIVDTFVILEQKFNRIHSEMADN